MKEFLSLNRTIKIRVFMQFIGALCFSTVGSSMTIYYNQHLGAGITGFLLIASSVVSFAIGLWSGHLSDVRGRRPLMLFSTLITAAGGFLAAFSNSALLFNPWLTYVGFLVISFGYGFFGTAASAMLVDVTNADNRKFVYSIQYWVINVSILLGSALSGWFFRDYLFFLLLAVALEELLSFALVFFFIEESFDPQKNAHKVEKNLVKSYFSVVKDRTFMLYCFGSVFIAMIFNQMDYYLPVHLSDSFNSTAIFGIPIYGQRMLTIFLMINTLIIVFFMNFFNRLTKNWSRQTGISVGIILQGSGFALAFLGHNLTTEIIAALVATIGEMILVPSSQAFRADLMEGEQVGTYSGAFSITQPLANVLCGLLVSGSGIYGNIGMAIIMIVIIVLGAYPAVRSVNRYEKLA